MNDQAVDDLMLAAVPTAVGTACAFVTCTFRRWHLGQATTAAACAVVSLLVTEAVRTTGIQIDRPFYDPVYDHLAMIGVRLHLQPPVVVIEVSDSDPAPPRAALPAATGCRDWGYYGTEGGKTIWCQLSLIPDPRADDTAELPPVRASAHPPAATDIYDIDSLHRFVDRLRDQ